ncbi:MAG: DUF4013 domain-containing protein [Anaerolineae bacterium]
MDYGKSFTFPFKDQDWLMKFIVGGVFVLLSGILVGIPFVLGYMVEMIRNVIAGNDEVLPAWDNLGEKFMQGLTLAVILLILFIPSALLACITSVFSSIAANSSSDAVMTIIALINILVVLLQVLWGLIIAVFAPAIILRYTITRQFGATLKFGALWSIIRANLGQYILVLVISWAASVVASFGTILCIIGVFLTMFWAYLVQAHLLGQYQRNFVSPGGVMPMAGTTPIAPL